MIDPAEFAKLQMELTAEFARYLIENPQFDEQLPLDAYIYFELDGAAEFNRYSEQLAARRQRDDGMTPVRIRVKGLSPPQGSRLIEPQVILS